MTLFFQSVLCGAKDGVADVNTLSTFSCSQDFSSYHRLKAIHVLWPLTIFLLARNSINKTSTFAACIPIVIYIYVYCSLATHHRFFLNIIGLQRVNNLPCLQIGCPRNHGWSSASHLFSYLETAQIQSCWSYPVVACCIQKTCMYVYICIQYM